MNEPLAIGDYVVATKYQFGNPKEHWCVGFIKEFERDRIHIVDGEGNLFRHNGFRRAKKISPERGKYLIENKNIIEQGSYSVWWWVRKRMEE
jgi:hypothetical protein